MQAKDKLRLRQVSRKLESLRKLTRFQVPDRGWIFEIRGAIGMSASQLAKRLGVSQPAVAQYERNEAKGTITLGTLRNAAAALECELVYALVPKAELEVICERQAHRIAEHAVGAAAHSMDLERQQVSAEEIEEQVKDLAKQILDEKPRSLWNEP